MRPRLIAATAAVLLLALTGCSSAPELAASTPAAPASTPEDAATPTSAPTAAPATVAPSEAVTDPEAEADAWYLAHSAIREVDLPDADKIAAGRYACEQVAAGNLGVVAIEGIDAAWNQLVVYDSVMLLCPEHAEVFQQYLADQPL